MRLVGHSDLFETISTYFADLGRRNVGDDGEEKGKGIESVQYGFE